MDHKKEKPPKRKRIPAQNPIEASVSSWLSNLQSPEGTPRITFEEDLKNLITSAPRRWTVYPPLLLLPAGAFTSPAWKDLLSSITQPQLDELWQSILSSVSLKTGGKQKLQQLTHLAVNEGIPLHESTHKTNQSNEVDTSQNPASSSPPPSNQWNHLRTPSGLRMLYGDFGPAATSSTEPQNHPPDFESALWVTTTQNSIHQTWAPRWTMFSRGNIKEKARLLAFHDSPAPPVSSSQPEPKINPLNHRNLPLPSSSSPSPTPPPVAIDLYAGIGYFAFSYASLGFRVLCWELNPWSVEALRRGAEMNGWGVRVVIPPPIPPPATSPSSSSSSTDTDDYLEDFFFSDENEDGPRIIVFQEDNARALGRIRRWRQKKKEREEGEGGREMNVVHINCGLLPTSLGCWGMARDIIVDTAGDNKDEEGKKAWLHLHENVGVDDIEKRKGEIEEWFNNDDRGREEKEEGRTTTKMTCRVDHVELVKTYAPGVWHCVFDLYINTNKV